MVPAIIGRGNLPEKDKMTARIRAIEYYLPETVSSADDLAAEFPDWGANKIARSTGIEERHIAAPEECASDLAAAAARKLFDSGAAKASEIDFVLFCTQSPDYLVPTTACLLQDSLEIPNSAGALDYNLGHSGYVYGLSLAKGLIETGQASRLLLLTGETYSKYIHPEDRSVRTIFGDAGSATLITANDEDESAIGPFVFGTDGNGAPYLMVATGAAREARTEASRVAVTDDAGNTRSRDNLVMDGSEVFAFTIGTVPKTVAALLEKSGKSIDEIDLFVFHQANAFILEHLRKKSKIPAEKFWVALRHCGNTVSNSIPIALREAQSAGRLSSGMTVMVVGYGAGLSWAATLLRWP